MYVLEANKTNIIPKMSKQHTAGCNYTLEKSVPVLIFKGRVSLK